MNRFNILILVFTNLLFLRAFADENSANEKLYEVNIACFYEYSGLIHSAKYDYLSDSNNKNLKTKALFDKKNKLYLLSTEEQNTLKQQCKEQLKRENKIFTKMMAVSAKISSLSANLLGNFYNIKDLDYGDRKELFNAASEIYKSFNNLELSNDMEKSATDQQTIDFLKKINSISDPTTDRKEFISSNAISDLSRANLIIRDKSGIIYKQENKIVTSKNNLNKRIYEENKKIQYALEPFIILEESINSSNKYDILSLRKNLARALHSRMQGFEAVALFYVFNALNNNDKNIVFSIEESGRTSHSMVVENDQLIMSTEMFYEIKVQHNLDMIPLGLIQSVRTVNLDLNQGTFSLEKIMLRKDF